MALATSKRYDEAATLFTKQADHISEDPLMKTMAVRWFFLAAICHLQASNSFYRRRALDIAERALMADSPEAKFIKVLLYMKTTVFFPLA